MEKIKKLLPGLAALVVAVFLMFSAKPQVSEAKFETFTCNLSQIDELLVDGYWEGRQAGWVNLEKFKQICTVLNISCKKNTLGQVTFSTDKPSHFFGRDKFLLDKKNLPIKVSDDGCSFTAKLKKENGVDYVFIPYHVLISLVGFCPDEKLK